MNFLKASLTLAVSILALTATAANDIANFGRYAAVSKGESLTLPEGLYVASTGAISQKIIIRN